MDRQDDGPDEECVGATSADKSELKAGTVQFLQSQYDSTVRGLHREIDQLSRQCADLQFQLVFHGVVPSKEELLEAQVAALNRQLQDLSGQLERQTETAAQLAHDLDQQQARYGEDVSARNLIIVKLRRDVQEKAKRVADLQALANQQHSEHGRTSGSTTAVTRLPGASLSSRGRRSVSGEAGASAGVGSSRALPFTSGVSRQLVDKYWRSSSLPRCPSSASSSSSTCSAPVPASCTESSNISGTASVTGHRKPFASGVSSSSQMQRASEDNANVWHGSMPHLNS